MTPIAIEDLVNGCRLNIAKFQKLLYEQFSPVMFSVCRRYTKQEADAEDIMQEGFIKVFTKIHLYTGEGSLEGWMQRIMVNTALSFYRKNQCRVKTVDMDDVGYALYDHSCSDDNEIKGLLNCLNTLPENYLTTLNLFAIEGYSHKEISNMIGISPLQSRISVYRARTMLRKNINMSKPEKKRKSSGLKA